MSDLEEKLESVLGNPQAMAQIMSLAQSLNLGGPGGQSQAQPPSQEQPAAPAQGGNAVPPPAPSQGGEAAPPPEPPAASGGLGSLLGSLDPQMLSSAASLLGQFSDGGDDKRTALLTALRPFVREERYAKLDKAIQIAKLSRLIRSGLDLFRARKEDGHV